MKVSVSILMLSFWAVVAVTLPAHIAMLAITLMMVLTSIVTSSFYGFGNNPD